MSLRQAEADDGHSMALLSRLNRDAAAWSATSAAPFTRADVLSADWAIEPADRMLIAPG